MGYTTEFVGQINVNPSLNEQEQKYLNEFAGTRRMLRMAGPYYVDGTGLFGQGNDLDIIDYNEPPFKQPGLWCKWVPNKEGEAIVWDGREKFYESANWMTYLIEHFLKPDPIASQKYPDEYNFFMGHQLSGSIIAQGEDIHDRWNLIVKDNVVNVVAL